MLTLLKFAWIGLGLPIAGRLGVIVALGFALLAIGQCTAKDAALRAVDSLTESIEAPRTGWAARLADCEAGAAALEATIRGHNAAVDALQREGEARGAEITKARQATRQEAERADRAAEALKRLRPAGGDLCARMLAVDEAVKEIGR